MEITKLVAARRQIDSAIAMYFDEGDEVAVHTLVGAAMASEHARDRQCSCRDRSAIGDIAAANRRRAGV